MQFMFIGGGPATIDYQTDYVKAPHGSNVISLASVPFGEAAATRRAFLIIHGLTDSNRAISSVTIGGAAATIHIQASEGIPFGSARTAIVSAPLPTGTTANVTITFASGSADYSYIVAALRVTNLISSTAIDTAQLSTSGGDPHSLNIDVLNFGVMLAGITSRGSFSGYSISGVTERYEEDYSSTVHGAGGSLAVTADQTNRTVSFLAGHDHQGVSVAASFR